MVASSVSLPHTRRRRREWAAPVAR